MSYLRFKLGLLLFLQAFSSGLFSSEVYNPFVELEGKFPKVVEKLTQKEMSLGQLEKELGKKSQKSGSHFYFDLNGEKQNLIVELDEKDKVKTALFIIPEKSRPDVRFFNNFYQSFSTEKKKKLIEAEMSGPIKHESGRFIILPLEKRKISFKFKDNSNKSLVSIKVSK